MNSLCDTAGFFGFCTAMTCSEMYRHYPVKMPAFAAVSIRSLIGDKMLVIAAITGTFCAVSVIRLTVPSTYISKQLVSVAVSGSWK